MSRKENSKRRALPVLHTEPLDWGKEVIVTLFRTNSRMERRIAEVLGAHGMTLAQFDVLASLDHGEGITQQELAGRLLVTKGNVVGLIDRLCKVGLVERRDDPADRRANLLFLTDVGRKRLAEALPSVGNYHQKLLREFTQDELRQMHQFLRRLEDSAEE